MKGDEEARGELLAADWAWMIVKAVAAERDKAQAALAHRDKVLAEVRALADRWQRLEPVEGNPGKLMLAILDASGKGEGDV